MSDGLTVRFTRTVDGWRTTDGRFRARRIYNGWLVRDYVDETMPRETFHRALRDARAWVGQRYRGGKHEQG